jgi:hypothetical protein
MAAASCSVAGHLQLILPVGCTVIGLADRITSQPSRPLETANEVVAADATGVDAGAAPVPLLLQVIQLRRGHMERRLSGSSDSSGRTNIQAACSKVLATAKLVVDALQPRTADERRRWAQATQKAAETKARRRLKGVAQAEKLLRKHRKEADQRREGTEPAVSSVEQAEGLELWS